MMNKIEANTRSGVNEINKALADRQPIDLQLPQGAMCWLHRRSD